MRSEDEKEEEGSNGKGGGWGVGEGIRGLYFRPLQASAWRGLNLDRVSDGPRPGLNERQQ